MRIKGRSGRVGATGKGAAENRPLASGFASEWHPQGTNVFSRATVAARLTGSAKWPQKSL